MFIYIALLFMAYVLGSVPTAVWLSRHFLGQDVRALGSKNAGSTNMYRVFGWRAGLITQLTDIFKGGLAALCRPASLSPKQCPSRPPSRQESSDTHSSSARRFPPVPDPVSTGPTLERTFGYRTPTERS